MLNLTTVPFFIFTFVPTNAIFLNYEENNHLATMPANRLHLDVCTGKKFF